MADDFSTECKDRARRIADEIELVALGQVYRDEDGSIVYEDAAPAGEVPDEWEPVDMADWLGDDIYNIRYVLDSYKDYCAVEIMIACGGPNIWASTLSGSVELYWGADKATWPLACCAVDALDEVGRMLYES